MSDEFNKRILVQITANISHHYKDRLMRLVFERQLPVARLLAIAIENEFERPVPFRYDYPLPNEQTEEYAYVDQASKILSYMKDIGSVGLDTLCLVRHDIGIPDKEEFLFAFKECLDKGLIESCKPKKPRFTVTEFPKGYLHYRLRNKNPRVKKKLDKNVDKYKMYQKLKKEFGDE